MEMTSVQSPDPSLHSLVPQTLPLLWDEKSIDPEDVGDEKKIELITLHNALRKLDKDMDYSAVVNPLLADQGPALAHIPRLTKTIQRLEKIKADFLRNEQEQLRGLAAPAESANGAQIRLTHSIESIPDNPDNGRGHAEIRIDDRHEQENPLATHSIPNNAGLAAGGTAEIHETRCRRRRRADQHCTFVPMEVLPRWGQLKRYTEGMSRTTYNDVVTGAEWVFQRACSSIKAVQRNAQCVLWNLRRDLRLHRPRAQEKFAAT